MDGCEILPAPLVDASVDLKDFPFTPLYRARLFGSEFHSQASDSEWRAGVTLWLKSWDQSPAGSLPNNDVALCRLAELGKDLKAWRKLSAGAMHGWILCSDGRLYHPVVAEGINDAWQRKQAQREKTKAARAALTHKRPTPPNGHDTDPVTEQVTDAATDDVTASVTDIVTDPVTGSKRQGQGYRQGREGKDTGTEGALGPTKKNINYLPSETASTCAPARDTEPILEKLNPELPESEGRFSKFVDRAPVARSARSAAIAALRRDQLVQKLIRFSTATMAEPDLSASVGGICGADPEHSDQWWLDHVDKLMRAKRWDDTGLENAA